MNGGTISDNNAYNGGGVYVSDGIFEMKNGALISDNSADNQGGGVYLNAAGSSLFTLWDGEISHNTTGNSGCVYVDTNSQFVMEGGAVHDNSLGAGSGWPGVVVAGGGFVMHAGRIYDHIGDGLYVRFGGTATYGDGTDIIPGGTGGESGPLTGHN